MPIRSGFCSFALLKRGTIGCGAPALRARRGRHLLQELPYSSEHRPILAPGARALHHTASKPPPPDRSAGVGHGDHFAILSVKRKAGGFVMPALQTMASKQGAMVSHPVGVVIAEELWPNIALAEHFMVKSSSFRLLAGTGFFGREGAIWRFSMLRHSRRCMQHRERMRAIAAAVHQFFQYEQRFDTSSTLSSLRGFPRC